MLFGGGGPKWQIISHFSPKAITTLIFNGFKIWYLISEKGQGLSLGGRGLSSPHCLFRCISRSTSKSLIDVMCSRFTAIYQLHMFKFGLSVDVKGWIILNERSELNIKFCELASWLNWFNNRHYLLWLVTICRIVYYLIIFFEVCFNFI